VFFTRLHHVTLRRSLPFLLAFSALAAVSPAPLIGQSASVGLFEATEDIGAPKLKGSAVYNGVSQQYTLTAGGVNMWAERDEFRLVWKKMIGDYKPRSCRAQTRVRWRWQGRFRPGGRG
jgi:hypothetical protein